VRSVSSDGVGLLVGRRPGCAGRSGSPIAPRAGYERITSHG